MARRRGRGKTLSQALDQRNRILDYYRNTGRRATASRIMERTMGVGGTIGNMADRIRMQGGDPYNYKDMNKKVSFKDRTTTPSDNEYNAAMARLNKSNGNANTASKGASNG